MSTKTKTKQKKKTTVRRTNTRGKVVRITKPRATKHLRVIKIDDTEYGGSKFHTVEYNRVGSPTEFGWQDICFNPAQLRRAATWLNNAADYIEQQDAPRVVNKIKKAA